MMKRFLRRVKEVFKDPPPQYEDYESVQIDGPTCEVLDLLADCKIHETVDTEADDSSIGDMGLWHSTPLARRHKSKISLTWVLKENLENANPKADLYQSEININRRVVNERYRKCKQRVVGRNEHYHNLKFRNCEELSGFEVSDSSEEYSRRRHRHRQRRKKKPRERFGYDIKDLDSFLTEASIDRPGNIPVVIAYPTALYQTQAECQSSVPLPLGTVVNAVFKHEHWLYAQTPHGAEGYVLYAACMPLPILPQRSSPQKKTPCWESSSDIYPRPCGNLTDTEKEQLKGRTRSQSECRFRRKKTSCAEKDFDTLYLKTKSVSNIDCRNSYRIKQDRITDIIGRKYERTKRQTLLVVTSDYVGGGETVGVGKGEVVMLERGGTDVDAEWFYVRKKDGSRGYVPAKVVGNGYI